MTTAARRTLTACRRKRDFDHTAEPTGDATPSSPGKRDADRIDFTLSGRKLKGAWTLVRSGGRSGRPANNWLLIKRGNNDVSALQAHDRSIHSGRSMSEIARGRAFDRSALAMDDGAPVSPADIPGARRRTVPKSFAPQLATLADIAPDGDDWVHEIKFDGYRMIVHVGRHNAQLLSRNGHDWTGRFAAQAEALGALAVKEAILDGEMVAMGRRGAPMHVTAAAAPKRG